MMHSGVNETLKLLLVFTLIQMGLVLGDPPGVWALYGEVSCQRSRVYVVFGLIVYDEYSLKL
jgi:hypothetical protein